jgi:hypothetical protein
VLAAVPRGATASDYRNAVVQRNVLAKSTDSTRKESLRRLRELYALDEAIPIFAALRKLHYIDGGVSASLLALQVAWARDPILRATTQPVLEASIGERVEKTSLAEALETAFPNHYSEVSRNTATKNSASSWTQSGHLVGHRIKIRQRVEATPAAATLALFLGQVSGFHGAAVFSSPWCRLLDLDAGRGRSMAQQAHRAGLLNLRAVGEVIELSFPMFSEPKNLPA